MFDCLPLLNLPAGRIAAAAGMQKLQAGMFFHGAPPGAQVDG
ncbi:MAG: hypothetical protein WAQ05_08390 [Rubrivivax sp.]